MGFQKLLGGFSVLALLQTLSLASPLSPFETYNDLSPRQGFDQTCGWNRPKDNPCPGMYYQSDLSCKDNATAVSTAIMDVSLIAHAALRALHKGHESFISPSDPLTGDLSPADHFFYFFDNDQAVASFVASIFQNIADCADGKNCPNNLIICGDQRFGASKCDAGQFGYVLDPNQYSATLNNKPKGGGLVFLCNGGMALPRNPVSCTTNAGANSLGYALLYEMVQVDVITRPDTEFLQQKTGWPNITQLTGDGDGKTPLKDIGWGTLGNGLKAKGLANADNYARFASWSWDLGFGSTPWNGTTCEKVFQQTVQQEDLQPVEG
ncbi:MAG: hypothetical protein Q9218_006145 [Villophora microphyllina]